MEIGIGDVVLSLSGRDKGLLLLVVGAEDEFLLLANGRARRSENPKKKRRRHVSLQGRADEKTRAKLSQTGRLPNSDLRRALSLFTGEEQYTS